MQVIAAFAGTHCLQAVFESKLVHRLSHKKAPANRQGLVQILLCGYRALALFGFSRCDRRCWGCWCFNRRGRWRRLWHMHRVSAMLFPAHIDLVACLHDHKQAHCGKHHKTQNDLPHTFVSHQLNYPPWRHRRKALRQEKSPTPLPMWGLHLEADQGRFKQPWIADSLRCRVIRSCGERQQRTRRSQRQEYRSYMCRQPCCSPWCSNHTPWYACSGCSCNPESTVWKLNQPLRSTC